MGQRLVVSIIQDTKRVAAIYYHWSAYFLNTIYELTRLSEYILNAENENKNVLLGILEGVENNGGCLRGIGDPECKYELDKAKELFPDHEFKTVGSRNEGLISFTEEGMEAFDSWSEGDALIEIDTHKISHGVCYDSDEWLEYVDTPVDENDEGEFILSSASVNIGGHDINLFEMTCETILTLAEYIGERLRLKKLVQI